MPDLHPTIISNEDGKPAFVVLPFREFEAMEAAYKKQAYLEELRNMPLDTDDPWVKTTARYPQAIEKLRAQAARDLAEGNTYALDDVLDGRISE